MKKLILLFAVAVATLLTSCISVQTVKSDKPVKSEKRQAAPFERVRLLGTPTVYYAQGDTISIRVEAPEDLLEYVVTESKDSCLTIRISDQAMNLIRNQSIISGDDISVYVTSPDIIEVSVSGSGDFKSDQRIDTDNLRVELKGSGDISLADIICDHLSTSLVGSGDVRIDKVVAQSSAIEMVGSGDLKINHENVANTNVLLKGSGDIVASFLNCGNVVSELRGSGDITFSGDVRSLTNSQLGSGDYHINRLNIKH